MSVAEKIYSVLGKTLFSIHLAIVFVYVEIPMGKGKHRDQYFAVYFLDLFAEQA